MRIKTLLAGCALALATLSAQAQNTPATVKPSTTETPLLQPQMQLIQMPLFQAKIVSLKVRQNLVLKRPAIQMLLISIWLMESGMQRV